MRTVGIVGGSTEKLMRAFEKLPYTGVRLIDSGFDKNDGGSIDNILAVDALVAQDASPVLTYALQQLNGEAFLILNADKKEILPFLARKRGPYRLITYGFNNKSCVTASSTMNGVIQACVQRGFVSLDGKMQEPGEFDFPLGDGFDDTEADAALGLAAACLACGVI